MASSHSLGSSTRRSTFDNTFGFPLHQPVPDRSARLFVPVRSCAAELCPDYLCSVSCVVCKDKIGSPRETTSLECGHHMCNHCLKHSFRVSLTDPKALAPRCCKVDIPPKHVAKLFDSAFHHDWHQKFSERPSLAPPRGRLFCPSPRCGTVIRNEDIRHDGGHRHGRCSRCKTKVCCVCHEHWHHPRDCPGEVDADRSFEPARVEDRTLQQRCHRCDTVVDFKEGRSHMTWYGPSRAARRASAPAFINIWCSSNRCGAESCTACGDRYKACNCPRPWFDESLEAEPAEYMDVPAIAAVTARPNPFGGRAGHAKRFDTAPQSPRAFRSDADIQLTNSLRPRPSSFEEAAMLHRLQERREPKHARPFADFPDHDREPAPARERAPRTRRTVCEEYRRRPATVVVSPPPQMQMHAPPPPHSAYDGPISAYDYAGAGRAPRGIRYASPERWQAASRPASPDRDSRWHIPSRIHSRAQSRAPSRPPSRPMSPEGLTWGGPSRQQSPERGRWRSHSRAQSADRGALWRARSVGAPIYDSPDRERSPSAETHRHPSRYPSRAPSRAASRPPSRVISRAPSPPDTRRAPSPPASRRAPSPVRSMRSRRAPSRARTQRAPSPPGTHRSPSPDQRRSHTPARSRAQTPDRRRSHTPDARRTSSLDHLADRFNPEIRGSTPGMAGALAPLGYMGIGHMGLMNMMSPPPPPPSYAATHSGYAPTQLGHLPMVPVPPPAASGGRRHNMMDEEVYSSIPGHRGAARSPGGLTKFPHEQEPVVSPIDAAVNAGLPYAPHVRRRPPQATRVHGHEPPKPSVLAGLAGPGRGLNRVFEWRNYVEPGIPEGEHPPSIVAQ